jgi:uncharacterized membrane protein
VIARMPYPASVPPYASGARHPAMIATTRDARSYPDAPRARVRPGSGMNSTTYNLALFFHLLGALLFVSGIVLAGAGFEVARRRERTAEVALLLSMTRIGVSLVAVGGLLLPIFGLWMVHLGRWGYGSGWVDWALALYAVALVLGGLGGQRPKQARRLATRLAEVDAPVSEQLRALLDDRVSLAENYASLLVVLAILALMVFK